MGQADILADRLLASQSGNAHALNLKALIAWQMDQKDLALRAARQAVAASPDCAEINFNLAFFECELGLLGQAIARLKQVLMAEPDNYRAGVLLGRCFLAEGNFNEAALIFQQVLAGKPDAFEAHMGLAWCYARAGQRKQATASFMSASELKPQSQQPLIGAAAASLPFEYAGYDEMPAARQRFAGAVEEAVNCLSLDDAKATEDAFQAVAKFSTCQLLFSTLPDRTAKESWGKLVATVMSTRFHQLKMASGEAPGKTSIINVGFASAFFCDHPIWHLFIKGLADSLDKTRFSLFGYRLGGTRDDITNRCRGGQEVFDRFYQDMDLQSLAARIQDDNLQVLIYPELGFDSATYALASIRLAPVQCAAWGYPATSGLPTIDYYLSSEAAEPNNGEENYSERLVRLPGLGLYWQSSVTAGDTAWNSARVKDRQVRYLCLEEPGSYLPGYGELLAAIACRVPHASFALSGTASRYSTSFGQQVEDAFAARGLDWREKVVFLEKAAGQDLETVFAPGDIVLDSNAVCGFATTIKALRYKLPVVTTPGAYLRSRSSAAALRIIGAGELVAESPGSFVDIAARAALDMEWLRQLEELIERRSYLLLRDPEVAVFLDAFLRNCVSNALIPS